MARGARGWTQRSLLLFLSSWGCLSAPPASPPAAGARTAPEQAPANALLPPPPVARNAAPPRSDPFPPPASGVSVARSIPPRLARPLRRASIDASRWQLDPVAEGRRSARRSPRTGQVARSRDAFLSAAHRAIHPIFSDEFLASLPGPASSCAVSAPPGEPLVDCALSAVVVFEVDRSGALTYLGVERSSGVPEFDLGVLESLVLAFPVDVPDELEPAAADGVFVWSFSRDPRLACTTFNAELFERRAGVEVRRTPTPTHTPSP